jgi:hypothetical protein
VIFVCGSSAVAGRIASAIATNVVTNVATMEPRILIADCRSIHSIRPSHCPGRQQAQYVRRGKTRFAHRPRAYHLPLELAISVFAVSHDARLARPS